jgi:hypothetical protein
MSLFLPQMTHDLTWNQTLATAVGCQPSLGVTFMRNSKVIFKYESLASEISTETGG